MGRTVQFPAEGPDAQPQVLQIVGVVPALTWDLFETEAVDAIYAPLGQHFDSTMRIHVRASPNADAQALLPLAGETLRQIDPQIPVTELQTLEAFHREGPILRVMNIGAICLASLAVLHCSLASSESTESRLTPWWRFVMNEEFP